MVAVRIIGGLGNQMFVYVFAQYLKKKYNVDIQYTIDFYLDQEEHLDKRNIELDKFDIDLPIIDSPYLKKLESLPTIERKLYMLWNYIFNKKNSFMQIKEKRFKLFKELVTFKNQYYVGYFQETKYVDEFKDELNDWFKLKDSYNHLRTQNKTLKDIKNSNAIALGVRRGDYIKNNMLICDLDYYHRAIKLIEEKIENPVFYFFSDDIDWCKENIKIDSSHFFVSSNDELPFENIELMSKCKHNIISNSTYHWWGAYLNQNKDKIIISPKKWDMLSFPEMVKI